MNWCILKSSMRISFWIFICCTQISSAGHRVIRPSHSSQLMHHELELKGDSMNHATFTECMNAPVRVERSSKVLTSTESVETVDEIKFDEHFLECLKEVVEFGCYEILPNKSVHVPMYHKLFKPTQYYIHSDTKELFICPDLFKESFDGRSQFLETAHTVLIVSIAISTFCIVLYGVLLMFLKKLRNELGYYMLSLSVALLLDYLCSFIFYFKKEVPDCTVIGMVEAFAILGYFFWLNVMSIDIRRSLRMATAELRLAGNRPMFTRLAVYSAYAWGVPLFIIVGELIAGRGDSCWLKNRNMIVFITPCILLLLNILLFISSVRLINRTSMNERENKADLWSTFYVSYSFTAVRGLMWIFNLLAALTPATWLGYLSILCNVLEGLLILFSYTISKKIRDMKEREDEMRITANELQEVGDWGNATQYRKTSIFNCNCNFHLDKLFSFC